MSTGAGRLARALASLFVSGCGAPLPSEAGGSDELLVGVVPAGVTEISCPQGSRRESAIVSMDDENDTHCSSASGDLGEGIWLSPQAVKLGIPDECPATRTHTTLRFCRTLVAADAFKPLTLDATDSSRFYATLKFGERCPAHSVEIRKHIINEDEGNQNHPVPAGDLLYPNELTDDARGNYTELVFCFFRAAPSEDDVMAEFPELGFPYAVFHDFEGLQPSFIIRKRWLYSDDSNQGETEQNRYLPDPQESPETLAFRALVENPRRGTTFDTYFDLGRVR